MVDATTPSATKVNYLLEPKAFSAQAIFNKKQTKLVSGKFFFTFDQDELRLNKNTKTNIKLTLDYGGSVNIKTTVSKIISTTRGKLFGYGKYEGGGIFAYTHGATEFYNYNVVYSIKNIGKTLFLGASSAWLKFHRHHSGDIVIWVENHKYSFEENEKQMKYASSHDPSTPQRKLSYNKWIDKKTVDGIAHCTSIYNKTQNVHEVLIGSLKIVNRFLKRISNYEK